jgi:hypothetical protein
MRMLGKIIARLQSDAQIGGEWRKIPADLKHLTRDARRFRG